MAHPPWHRTARMIGGTPWVPYQIAASLQQELEKQANIENQALELQRRLRQVSAERDRLRQQPPPRADDSKLREIAEERDRLRRQVDDLAHENQRLQEREVDQSLGLRRELEALRAENARLLTGARQQRQPPGDPDDKLKRLAADLANVRRHTEERVARARREEKVARLRDIAELVDDLHRATDANPDHDSDWYRGHMAILSRARHMLEAAGASRIGAAGERFDPKVHEAVAHTPTDAPTGTIVHVQEPGYMLQDGVLVRAAKVVVAA